MQYYYYAVLLIGFNKHLIDRRTLNSCGAYIYINMKNALLSCRKLP